MKNQSQLPNFLKAFDRKDWYVYADSKINGPYFAKDLHKLPDVDSSGEKILVTQKKHSRWYAIQDARQPGNVTPSLSRKMSRELNREMNRAIRRGDGKKSPVESLGGGQAKSERREFSPSESLHTKESWPRTSTVSKQNRYGKKRKKKKKPQVVAHAIDSKVDQIPVSTREETKISKSRYLEDTKIGKQPAAATSVAPASATQVAGQAVKEIEPVQILRLGKVRGPMPLMMSVMSLGLTNYFWYQTICKEAFWHYSGQKIRGPKLLLHSVLSCFPLVSLYSCGKLLGLVQELESQNNYQYSKTKLLWLTLCPSIFLAKLQGALNIHWRLHRSRFEQDG
ncbi:MAG: hypothetical protein HRU19_26235 [Pseudobacteriovorax sp.]|nr:hypothetical protein [Pseudobacteriovorax sp.]